MKIPGYQIARKVSSGRHCVIYNAIEEHSSNTVSVRIYQQAATQTSEFKEHFIHSCNTIINNSIGVMVVVKKVGVIDAGCYLISDHFPSFQRAAGFGDDIDILQILDYAGQLADTLESLHGCGLVHGAVEQCNLYFPDTSRFVLGLPAFHRTLSDNLSISIDMQQDDLTYLAPESMTTGLTIATDYYALGTVLFEWVFNRKPYQADNPAQLLQLQKKAKLNLADPHYRNLMPLFQQLLHPDPNARICDAGQFKQALKQCDLQLSREVNSVPVTLPSQKSTYEKPPEAGLSTKNIWGIIVLIVIAPGLGLFFLSNEHGENTESFKIVKQDQSVTTENIPDLQPPSTPSIELKNQTDITLVQNTPEKIALALYYQAVEKLQDKNLGHALILVNNALKENPEHVSSQQLKVEIEQKIGIRSIIEKANKQLAAGKIDQPKNDNVIHSYQQLAARLGKNHHLVAEGYIKVANYYLQQARVFLDRNQFQRSRDLVASGLSVHPGYDPLKKLSDEIQKTENEIKRQQRQQEEELRLRKQREIELQKQRELQLAQQELLNSREQQALREEQIIQQKINALITQGEQILAADSFNLHPLSAATGLYYQAAILEPRNIRALVYRQNIVNAYIALASRQYQSADYNAARETVTLGLKLDNQHPALLDLEEQIMRQLRITQPTQNSTTQTQSPVN